MISVLWNKPFKTFNHKVVIKTDKYLIKNPWISFKLNSAKWILFPSIKSFKLCKTSILFRYPSIFSLIFCLLIHNSHTNTNVLINFYFTFLFIFFSSYKQISSFNGFKLLKLLQHMIQKWIFFEFFTVFF